MSAQTTPAVASRPRLAAWCFALLLIAVLISGFSPAAATPLASTPSLTVVGSIDLGSMQQVKVVGTIGYFVAYPNEAQIIDLADVARPQPLGPIELGWVATAVQVSGDRLYVAGGSTTGPYQPSVRIYDIENPRTPVLLGTYTARASAYDLAIAIIDYI
jgi:hypothetical protein